MLLLTASVRRASASLRSRPLRLRQVSSAAAAYDVLGLPTGSSGSDVKKRYYELAKQTHPDTMPAEQLDEATSADGLQKFLAVQGAFEFLMEELKHANKPQPTSANAAARSGGGARPSRPGSAPRRGERPLSLAEILCQRLDDEPGVDGALRIWAEILEQRLQVTERVANALFRECAAELPPTGKRGFFDDTGSSAAEGAPAKAGIQVALEILRQGSKESLIPSGPTRIACLCQLIKWFSSDLSFEQLMDECGEAERTPEAFAELQAAYYIHTGIDPLGAHPGQTV